MQTLMTPQQRQGARREILTRIEQGVSVREAQNHCPVQMHRATVYRLLKRAQIDGESALSDGRHGHPAKLRGEILTFLKEYCQSDLSISSSAMQCLLLKRFGLSISVSQLNRVRAAHCLSRIPVPREKKAQNGYHDYARLS